MLGSKVFIHFFVLLDFLYTSLHFFAIKKKNFLLYPWGVFLIRDFEEIAIKEKMPKSSSIQNLLTFLKLALRLIQITKLLNLLCTRDRRWFL